MSMASQNGRPKIISGALQRKKARKMLKYKVVSHFFPDNRALAHKWSYNWPVLPYLPISPLLCGYFKLISRCFHDKKISIYIFSFSCTEGRNNPACLWIHGNNVVPKQASIYCFTRQSIFYTYVSENHRQLLAYEMVLGGVGVGLAWG